MAVDISGSAMLASIASSRHLGNYKLASVISVAVNESGD
jgi:hypothetical protein